MRDALDHVRFCTIIEAQRDERGTCIVTSAVAQLQQGKVGRPALVAVVGVAVGIANHKPAASDVLRGQRENEIIFGRLPAHHCRPATELPFGEHGREYGMYGNMAHDVGLRAFVLRFSVL